MTGQEVIDRWHSLIGRIEAVIGSTVHYETLSGQPGPSVSFPVDEVDLRLIRCALLNALTTVRRDPAPPTKTASV